MDMNRMFSLKGKVALVTGAAYGIGFAIAEALAAAGAKIAFNCRGQAHLEKALADYQAKGIDARGYLCDVTEEAQVQAMTAQIEAELGTVDILVNNAGIIKRVPMTEMPAAEFRQVIDIDLTAPFIVSKAVLPAMIRKGGGKIINICSMMSELGRETVSAYAAAKGGLKMLTRNIASEYGAYNIQCNGIGPGYIATPQTAPLRERQPDGSRHPFDQFIVAKTPQARWGTPEDLRGVGPSQGVWAPCLTYDSGNFYLVYTVVRAFYCNMYDTYNYLVTARDIRGPWSEPVPLNDFGFDPSLFHDEDGRKYLVSMVTDHRVPKKYAGRLVLQEYDAEAGKMVGPVRDIYQADKIFLEGPHIFKRNGWYYLFSADTGTGEGHGQTIQRSRRVWGPYEMYHPQPDSRREEGDADSILTSRHHPELPLQKAGHCDLVETQDGEWYAVHLCGRPSEARNPAGAARFAGCRRYMLGRETAIQSLRWTEDGWLELACGGVLPQSQVQAPRCADRAPFRPWSGTGLTPRRWIWTISPCGSPWTAATCP